MLPILTTARLCLAPLSLSDAPDLFTLYGDPRVGAFLGDGRPQTSLAELSTYLEARLPVWAALGDGLGRWTIRARDADTIASVIILQPLPPTTGVIELGWHICYSEWGHGFATEAARAVLIHAFDTVRLSRVVAVVRRENVRSAAVARRLGMSSRGMTTAFYNGSELELLEIERGPISSNVSTMKS